MTNKEKTNYARLYVGCECEVMLEDANGKFTIKRKGMMSWSHEDDDEFLIWTPKPEDYDVDISEWDFRWKLILRPLDSMTGNEFIELEKEIPHIEQGAGVLSYQAKRTAWFLMHGFDMFNLLDTDIAIKKETL